jgi:4-diphosphocytidyl-2-C-methyl-D-erythritol kinase
MPAITEEAPPKVNLTLKVRGRRTDGYHDIESLIAFATGIGDVVRLKPGERVCVDVSGPFGAAITGENLLNRTLARLAAAEPRLRLGSVALEKRLPVAAGIGGGSADAGALLRAVRRANPSLEHAVDWLAIAASLGADVPVCLKSEPALVWGVGESLIPVPDLPRLPAVLLNPLAPVPADKTAQVFGRLSASPAAGAALPPAGLPRFANAEELIAFMRAEGNDLLAAATATVPVIADVEAALAACRGCLYVGLSGAGPTCFGIFRADETASAAAVSLRQQRADWWAAATVLGS